MVTPSPKQVPSRQCRLVDVRTADEFARERLEGAECVPLDRLPETASTWDLHDKVILICDNGARSDQAARCLGRLGFASISVVVGGLEACKKAGLAVIVEGNVKLPEKFRDRHPGRVFDFSADTARNYREIAKIAPDPEAESGITSRLDLRGNDPQRSIEKYKLPMPWGLYDPINKERPGGAIIKPESVPGPGYHWYRMGTFKIGLSYYVHFFWSWVTQFDIDRAADPRKPGQQFDIWASIKFEGPAFPHARPEDKNAICVERVVLIKAEQNADDQRAP